LKKKKILTISKKNQRNIFRFKKLFGTFLKRFDDKIKIILFKKNEHFAGEILIQNSLDSQKVQILSLFF